MDEKKTILEFTLDSLQDLAAFSRYWEARNKENPGSFPERMGLGEWEEQLYHFRRARWKICEQ